MKTFLLLSAIISVPVLGLANEIPVSSNVKEATVFVQGAELKREVKTSIPKGISTVVFQGLSSQVDENTIRVGGSGNFTILSVNKRVNHLSDLPKPKAMLVLEDSLDLMQRQLESLQADKYGLEEEKNLILKNQDIKGSDQSLSAAELKAMADFYRTRLSAISKSLSDQNHSIVEHQKEMKRVQNQINEYRAKRSQPVSEIAVEVMADAALNAQFNLVYMINDAGWVPSYDLTSLAKADELKVKYNAKIYQHSGIDWNQVKLTLSTGYPLRDNTKPEMHPWVLRFQEYDKLSSYSNRRTDYAQPAAVEMQMDEEVVQAGTYQWKAKSSASLVKMVENQLSTLYNISIPYNIPSDQDVHTVHIQDHTLKANYKYYAAPKLDKQAFLVAGVTDWSNFNLMPGEAKLFVDNTYVGKSYFNTQSTEDTLLVSMGRDPEIVINRKRVKDYSEKRVIGSNKRETIGVEVSVKNTKSVAVDLTLQDQIPISSNNDITVELQQNGGGVLTAETGMLEWEVTLKPGESKTFTFVYEVKYPKDKQINL